MESTKSLRVDASRAIDLAAQHAKGTAHEDGHWAGPILSDTTCTTQYIFTLISLNQPIDRPSFITYFLSTQEDDGSWMIAPKYPYGGNLSVTVETYLALKTLGFPTSHHAMVKARDWILSNGGVEKVRHITRLFLAMFGIISWSSIPQFPPEMVLLPSSFPLSIFKTGAWARTTIVPLLVLQCREPVYQLPLDDTGSRPDPACYLDELWCNKPSGAPLLNNGKLRPPHIPYIRPMIPLFFSNPIAFILQLVDPLLLYLFSPILSRLSTRRTAIKRCMEHMITRQEPEGPYGGVTIRLCFYLRCLALEGYDLSSKEISSGLEALRHDIWDWESSPGGDDDIEKSPSRKERGKYLQPSTSPIWDTLLMVRGLLDCRQTIAFSSSSGSAKEVDVDGLVENALRFVHSKEIREADVGDWQVYRPGVEPGSYPFEYSNRWFPDIDDTAMAVLTFLQAEKVVGVLETETPSTSTAHELEADGGICRRRKMGSRKATMGDRTPDGEMIREQGFGLDSEVQETEPGEKEEQEERESDHIIRAAKWCLAMQNSDGGWVAFDSSDGSKWLWNSIPFSDMDCMCDSSCPDITGRCLEMLGLLTTSMTISDAIFQRQIDQAVYKGINYLRKNQAEFGGWWARWGIHYLYGTSNALCALYYFRDLPHVKEMIANAVKWIESVQNPEGGWGEQDDSFLDPSRAGKGPTTPSQTAWALMALLRHASPVRESVARGVRWLVENQKVSVSARSPVLGGSPGGVGGEVRGLVIWKGIWEQEIYTGVGHPNQIGFGYDMYRHYFPMIALGRYLTAVENRIGEEEVGGKQRSREKSD